MKYEIWKDFKIEDLITLYEKKEINLEPPYQRKDIWAPRDKKLLINSIQRGYPIQNFYIQKMDKGFDMVDGQQRTRAIVGYYKDLFPSEEKIFFKDLKSPDKKHFLTYRLEIAAITKLEEGEIIEDFYSRVNSTGKRLNRPELKKAEYFDTKFLELIQEIAELKELEDLDLFSSGALRRMIDMDFISELLALIKSGITEKKLEVDKLFENDISKSDRSFLLTKFKEILAHFVRFNKIKEINKTRYKQKNDFYTLFGFIKDNIALKEDVLDAFYKILIFIDEDINPSNEECVPFYDYAENCVSQSNSKTARESRSQFLNTLFLNETQAANDMQKAILKFYGLKSTDVTSVGQFTVLDIKKLQEVISKS